MEDDNAIRDDMGIEDEEALWRVLDKAKCGASESLLYTRHHRR